VNYWPATSGSHTVQAWVDDVNRIAESNENNNKLTANFSVP
jgi:subtilase family serine protease